MSRSSDGKKMSKSLRNFPDPRLIVDSYGADALRLFLINSPVVKGESLRFSEDGVKDVISRVLLPLLNSYRFFLGQAALLKKESNVDFRTTLMRRFPRMSWTVGSWRDAKV